MMHKPIKMMPSPVPEFIPEGLPCANCGADAWNDPRAVEQFQDVEKDDCIERHHLKYLCGKCADSGEQKDV